jgi:hypothetical protein
MSTCTIDSVCVVAILRAIIIRSKSTIDDDHSLYIERFPFDFILFVSLLELLQFSFPDNQLRGGLALVLVSSHSALLRTQLYTYEYD